MNCSNPAPRLLQVVRRRSLDGGGVDTDVLAIVSSRHVGPRGCETRSRVDLVMLSTSDGSLFQSFHWGPVRYSNHRVL